MAENPARTGALKSQETLKEDPIVRLFRTDMDDPRKAAPLADQPDPKEKYDEAETEPESRVGPVTVKSDPNEAMEPVETLPLRHESPRTDRLPEMARPIKEQPAPIKELEDELMVELENTEPEAERTEPTFNPAPTDKSDWIIADEVALRY